MQVSGTQVTKFRRALTLLLALAMMLPLAPALAQGTHGIVEMNNVLFRMQATSTADHWGYLNRGWVVEILGETKGSGYDWFKVKSNLPSNTNLYTGYIRKDVMRRLTTEEEAKWAANPVQGTLQTPGTPDAGPKPTTGYVRITQSGTNLRNGTTTSSTVLRQLDKGLILPYYAKEVEVGGYRWMYILDTQTNTYGYIRSDCYEFVNADGTLAQGPGVDAGSSVPGTVGIAGGSYGIALVNAANLRQTPGGVGVTAVPLNAVVTIRGALENGWYPVMYEGFVGYMQQSHLRVMTKEEAYAYELGKGFNDGVPGITDTSARFVKITAPRVNLRNKPDGSTILQMDKDIVIPAYGSPVVINGVAWQYVLHTPSGMYGYVHGSYYRYTNVEGNATNAPYVTPAPGLPQQTGYVKLTKNNVNLRQTPGGLSLKQLAVNLVLPYQGAPVRQGGYTWIAVTEPAGNQRGYVRSDCYTFVDKDGRPIQGPTVQPNVPIQPQPTQSPNQGPSSGVITLIKGGVNLRLTPGGGIIARLDRGLRLNYYGMTHKDGYAWYYVYTDKGAGYLRGDMVRPENGNPGGGSVPVPTAGPTQTGYIVLTKTNVNLRKTPGGLTIVQLPKGGVYALIGPIVAQGGYRWYFISANGHTGYVRNDVLRQLTADEADAYKKGIAPSPDGSAPIVPPVATGYVMAVVPNAPVRQTTSLDATVLATLQQNVVLPYRNSVSAGGMLWYLVTYNNQNAYVLASHVRIMSAEEYQQWLKNQGGMPLPTATAAPGELSNVAVTVMDRVFVRRDGDMNAASITMVYRQGTRVNLLGSQKQSGGYRWEYVSYNSVNGWIRGDMLRVLTKAEAGGGSTNPGGPGVTYRTLRKGMTGPDVTRLQQTLIALGLMPQNHRTGTYDTVTEEAVKQYQRAKGLFVDGVAGQRTQDALYGTKPSDTVPPVVDTNLYPVEVVDWYTGDIQTVWGKGQTATVTDVKTGLSFRAKRWSGGFHADVEPLTADDTAIMCKIYGVTNAQQISDKNLYQRRPLWVTIKGRSFAASMYGVPHNYPEGDTISNNDFYGQFCVHFLNSRLHSKGIVDQDHMKAIQYAYDHAPAKK